MERGPLIRGHFVMYFECDERRSLRQSVGRTLLESQKEYKNMSAGRVGLDSRLLVVLSCWVQRRLGHAGSWFLLKLSSCLRGSDGHHSFDEQEEEDLSVSDPLVHIFLICVSCSFFFDVHSFSSATRQFRMTI